VETSNAALLTLELVESRNGTHLRPREGEEVEGVGGVGMWTCEGWKRTMSMSDDVAEPRRLSVEGC
jgi:hypothetical protein